VGGQVFISRGRIGGQPFRIRPSAARLRGGYVYAGRLHCSTTWPASAGTVRPIATKSKGCPCWRDGARPAVDRHHGETVIFTKLEAQLPVGFKSPKLGATQKAQLRS